MTQARENKWQVNLPISLDQNSGCLWREQALKPIDRVPFQRVVCALKDHNLHQITLTGYITE